MSHKLSFQPPQPDTPCRHLQPRWGPVGRSGDPSGLVTRCQACGCPVDRGPPVKGVVLAFSFQGQPLGTEASSVRSVAGPSQWLLGQTPWLLLHSCVRGAPSAKVSSERAPGWCPFCIDLVGRDSPSTFQVGSGWGRTHSLLCHVEVLEGTRPSPSPPPPPPAKAGQGGTSTPLIFPSARLRLSPGALRSGGQFLISAHLEGDWHQSRDDTPRGGRLRACRPTAWVCVPPPQALPCALAANLRVPISQAKVLRLQSSWR